MHPNQSFRKTSREKNIQFARERSFGVLSINANDGPQMSHVPFQLSEDGTYLEAHLVRSNPIVRQLDKPVGAVVAVSGGDAYVSPDWYGVKDQVPTWNYVAVHIRGLLMRLQQEELPGILDRLSANMEERLAPKPPWTTGKMDQEIYKKMQRQIIPIGLQVNSIEGTWKLSQNKPERAISGAQSGIENTGVGMETGDIAMLMQSKGIEDDS